MGKQIFGGMRSLMWVFAVLLLSGCANTWSAKVSTFEFWPENTMGQTYRIDAGPAQAGKIEFESIADTVRAAMGPTGLVEGGENARFIVYLDYSDQNKKGWAQRFADPYVDGWGPFWPGWGGYMGYYGGWGGGIYYSPRVVNVPVEYKEYSLSVLILDTEQDKKEVYRTTAVTDDDGRGLLAEMASLAQAIFEDFPGSNGQVREVKIKRK